MIKNADIKKLFGNSANLCNICKKNLSSENTNIGEMAHIIAKNSNGPRGNNLPADNTYDNLILLCPNHHSIVDKNPNIYTVEELRRIKKDHEQFILLRTNIKKDYQEDLLSLNILFKHIPIISFRRILLDLPNKISINYIDPSEFFEKFVEFYPHKYPFYDKELTMSWEIFICKLNELNELILGSISDYDNELITREQMMFGYAKIGYNVYVPTDCGSYMKLNKTFLIPKQIEIVTNEIISLQQELIYAHTNLVKYIRSNYRDIKW